MTIENGYVNVAGNGKTQPDRTTPPQNRTAQKCLTRTRQGEMCTGDYSK
jgi:hypothetical protein